jgi:hypothetical protein
MSDAFNLDEVRGIIIDGLQNGADDDAIRLEMFKAQVPFNKINGIFKEVAIAEGFRADPKVVREAIAAELENYTSEYTDWDSVTETAGEVVDNVEGATEGMVIAAMKRAAEAAEFDFPKKPKAGPRSRGASKIKSMIVDLYNNNKEITATELLEGIIDEVTGDYRVRNCIEYVNMYLPMMIAADQGVSLSEVKLAGFDKPALEAKYGGTTSYTKAEIAEFDDDDEEAA